MSKIILSAFADEYATPFEEQLQGMQHLGIPYIELRHADGVNVSAMTPEQVNRVKELLVAYGIGVSAIGSPLGKISLDGDLTAHRETAKRVFETANTLGTTYVRVFSFYAPEGQRISELKERVFCEMDALLRLAREHGVVLCHENEALIYGSTPESCRELLEQFGGELRCVYDMGNFVLEGVTPYPEAYRCLKPYIEYFHIKDALAAGAIVPPGAGEACIAEILAEHRATVEGDFFVSLEPHLQLFSGKNALVGRSFTNPYQYASAEEAFTDATKRFLEIIAK